MNAKGLIEAANDAVKFVDHPVYVRCECNCCVLCMQRARRKAASAIATHILATVRADDDEPVTPARLNMLGIRESSGSDGGHGIEYLLPPSKHDADDGDDDDYRLDTRHVLNGGWRVTAQGYRIAYFDTMGELRALCRALGILLTEPDDAATVVPS